MVFSMASAGSRRIFQYEAAGFSRFEPEAVRGCGWVASDGERTEGRKSKNELAFNQLFAVVGSCMRMPMMVTRAQFGFSIMGAVAQSRQRTRKTVVNRPVAASRSTAYPTLTALAIRALSAVVRVGQFG